MLSRRRMLLASAATMALAGCSVFTSKPVTDLNGEAASAFTAGHVALTALSVLIQTGVIAVAKAQSWKPYSDAVAAQFATLHGNIDAGVTISQAMIDAALTALNSFQVATKPVVALVTPDQGRRAMAQHHADLMAHPKAVAIGAIIAWVLANLDTLTSVGGAIYALIQQILAEFKSVPAGTTTIAQVDEAYKGFSDAMAAYSALIA